MSSSRSCIRAVTFDLWETLLLEKDGANSRRSEARCKNIVEAFNKLGMHVSPEQGESAMKRVVASLWEVWDKNEDVDHVEQLELLVKYVFDDALSLKNEWVDRLSSAYVSPFFDGPPYLNPEAESVLGKLAEDRKRIGLICNTGLTPGFALRDFLDSEGVLEYFDYLAFSDEIGFRKPDRRVFHLVARKLKTHPSNIVHVGDNLRMDVAGAKNAGFKAILFASEEGRDKIAEADPNSLVARSRKLGTLEKEQVVADRTITSLNMIAAAIELLETRQG